MLMELEKTMGIMPGTTICGLADGTAWATRTFINKFYDEFAARCPERRHRPCSADDLPRTKECADPHGVQHQGVLQGRNVQRGPRRLQPALSRITRPAPWAHFRRAVARPACPIACASPASSRPQTRLGATYRRRYRQHTSRSFAPALTLICDRSSRSSSAPAPRWPRSLPLAAGGPIPCQHPMGRSCRVALAEMRTRNPGRRSVSAASPPMLIDFWSTLPSPSPPTSFAPPAIHSQPAAGRSRRRSAVTASSPTP